MRHEQHGSDSNTRAAAAPRSPAQPQGDRARASTSTTARSMRCTTSISTFRSESVTALIGPSGCGKSTFLRCINRMNDTIPIARVTGKIEIDKQDIYDPTLDVVQLRARVGMVFQKPNPFPKSIYENVAYGPRIHGLAKSQGRSRRDRRHQPEAGRPVRGGEGSPGRSGHQPVRRPAAAAVHRARDRRQPRGHPDGRAVLGARSDRHRQDRGADGRAAARISRSSS